MKAMGVMEVTEGPSGYARERISQAKRDERPRLIDRATTGRSSRRQEERGREENEVRTHTLHILRIPLSIIKSKQQARQDSVAERSKALEERTMNIAVRKGVGSNPTGVTLLLSLFFSDKGSPPYTVENSLEINRISLASLQCHCKSVRKKSQPHSYYRSVGP